MEKLEGQVCVAGVGMGGPGKLAGIDFICSHERPPQEEVATATALHGCMQIWVCFSKKKTIAFIRFSKM